MDIHKTFKCISSWDLATHWVSFTVLLKKRHCPMQRMSHKKNYKNVSGMYHKKTVALYCFQSWQLFNVKKLKLSLSWISGGYVPFWRFRGWSSSLINDSICSHLNLHTLKDLCCWKSHFCFRCLCCDIITWIYAEVL